MGKDVEGEDNEDKADQSEDKEEESKGAEPEEPEGGEGGVEEEGDKDKVISLLYLVIGLIDLQSAISYFALFNFISILRICNFFDYFWS